MNDVLNFIDLLLMYKVYSFFFCVVAFIDRFIVFFLFEDRVPAIGFVGLAFEVIGGSVGAFDEGFGQFERF